MPDHSSYLVGYPDRLTAKRGEQLSIMASADRTVSAEAVLVRLGAGEITGEVHEVPASSLGRVQISPQPTQTGSFMTVPGACRPWPAGPFVAAILVQATRLGRPQVLMSQRSNEAAWALGIEENGRPSLWVTDLTPVGPEGPGAVQAGAVQAGTNRSVKIRGDRPLVEGAWYLVAAGVDPGGRDRVVARPLPQTSSWTTARSSMVRPSDGIGAARRPSLEGLLEAEVVIAAAAQGSAPTDGGPALYEHCCDGKLEAPVLLRGALDRELLNGLTSGRIPAEKLLVRWDFSARLATGFASGTTVPSIGAHGCDGTLWNTPTDAVAGHSWDGTEQDFRAARPQYAAIHFHSDDLDDCRWRPTVTFRLPRELASGAYAVKLTDERGRVDRVPFFVRADRPEAPLLYLVPTASYLAYANDHPVSDGSFSEATAGKTPVLYESDLLLHVHREWGLSCYDSHVDGSGVGISSGRRPMLNMRPTHRYHVGSWQLPSDLAVMDWIEERGFEFEVATDEDLHREGAALLAPYRAVISGTHPEYYSAAMLTALETYLEGPGRLVYLGANGFYWRVAFDPDRPWVMELRRGHSGSRAWESAPGEAHLAFEGSRGGLWRHLGHPPQRLTGVGYAAQGFDRCGWYRRLPDSFDPRVAFFFEGVDEEVFGTSGTIGGGCVGQEIDRYDPSLGSPRDALVLATSEGLTEGFQRCAEEILFTVPGTSALLDPDVRADVVYHVKPSGAAVFACGSIAWGGSLSVDPAVSRITENVLRRFCDPSPLPW